MVPCSVMFELNCLVPMQPVSANTDKDKSANLFIIMFLAIVKVNRLKIAHRLMCNFFVKSEVEAYTHRTADVALGVCRTTHFQYPTTVIGQLGETNSYRTFTIVAGNTTS